MLIFEYLKHKRDLNKINILLHHSWVIKVKGIKYDLLIDFGLFSKILKGLLGLFFEVIEISYLESETMEIVRNHPQYENEEQIRQYIQKYGNKPRFICEALEEQSKSTE